MPVVILELKEGERYRTVKSVHRSSNGNGARSVCNRLERLDRPFLEFNPTEMDEAQRERLTSASNIRTKSGVLVDLDERRLVLADEVDA